MKQRILITGASGFLGQHMTASLAATQVILIPVSRNAPGPFGDLLDPAATAALIHNTKPDVILHLAGRVPSRSIAWAPACYDRDNFIATRNLVIAAESLSPSPQILFAATAGVYPPGGLPKAAAKPQAASEEHAIGLAQLKVLAAHGSFAYALSKLKAELVLQTYQGPWTILRFPTLIGMNDKRGTFLHELALHLMTDQTPAARQLQRCADYLSVTDALRACKACLNNTRSHGQIVNVGSGRATTGFQAWKAMKRAGSSLGYRFRARDPRGEDKKAPYPGVVLAIDKAQELLDYAPKATLIGTCKAIWRDVRIQGPSPLAALFPNFRPS